MSIKCLKCPRKTNDKSSLCTFCRPSVIKRAPLKQKYKEKTEEQKEDKNKMRAFFQYLWEKLPEKKFCQSCDKFICGENLSLYHDHLLEKSVYPQFKYEEKNMFFVCGDCHTKKTNGFPTKKHKKAIEKAKEFFLK